jgi:hypothetical protein
MVEKRFVKMEEYGEDHDIKYEEAQSGLHRSRIAEVRSLQMRM